jgi:hypothetical protein
MGLKIVASDKQMQKSSGQFELTGIRSAAGSWVRIDGFLDSVFEAVNVRAQIAQIHIEYTMNTKI